MVAGAARGDDRVVVFYFGVYVLQVVGVLRVLGRHRRLKMGDLVHEIRGLSRYALCALLASMGGIPPTLGFFSKVLVLKGVVVLGAVYVAGVLVVSRVLRMFFYLRIVFGVAERATVERRRMGNDPVFIRGFSWGAACLVSFGGILMFF